MGSVDFQFTPPPEAPVFEPTEEEFLDPLAYIAKIRPIVEKTGICKIKPPPDWQPPFAVDVDNFKFTPRIQRLNELEAKTRIKLNFLDQIAKFWELQGRRTHHPVNSLISQTQKKLKFSTQGSTLRIPNVERKALDLFTLHKLVQDEGGFDAVTRDRKWSKLSTRMGYPAGRSVGSLLRGHYERLLYPYDMFLSGNNLGEFKIEECQEIDKDKDYVPHSIPSRQAIKPPAERHSRRSKRQSKDLSENESPTKTPIKCDSDDSVDYSTNNELKKLQFYGAGPKTPGASDDGQSKSAKSVKGSPAKAEKVKPYDPIDQIVCHTCARGDAEESMLLCDGCDDSYHTFCLVPPLNDIPKGDWRCPRCVAVECRKPQEAFGFEQATKEYTLQSFGEMADQFKSDYFNMPVHMVQPSVVEKEFWRITGAIDEDVTVEYGADLHTMDHGSGFPTKTSKNLMPGDEEYANSSWNLNNLPVAHGSVLSHINADISGMKIPWMYVGMCFATFCWHNEDHWSYSINYLHWGEPKTWYGVPGDKADAFENSMKSAAPELFESQPDLLHQLVTIMNPNILMKAGVPVYRTNQNAGEFVVTFPRAYHSGFNQGYNFAEAVNFCPSDWLSIGRHCIDHYSKLRRFCVFSHDELVCKMASDPDSLDLNLAASTYQDMLQMVETEKELRKNLVEKGVTIAEREAFELLPDDERQCDFCKTTCFLSAVTCSCSNTLVCSRHLKELCDCSLSKRCLRYRYTLDELPVMLHRLKVRAESFDNWAAKVKNALAATAGSKLELSEMKELISEAEEKKFPENELFQTLVNAVHEAEKCASVAQQLVSKKVRTRNRQLGDAKFVARLTLEELQLFYEQVNKLSCEIKEAVLVKDLLDQVIDFQQEAKEVFEEEMPDVKNLEKLIDFGVTLDIDLQEVPNLKQKLQQVRWLDQVQSTLTDSNQVTAEVLRKLLDSGVNLPPHATIERSMAELQELLAQVDRWEEKARICLQARPRHVMATLETIINEAKNIPALLPNTLALKDALKRAKEWTSKVELIQNGEHYPYLEVLENLVNKGRSIPVRLDQLSQLESQVTAAKSWRERTARTFLKKNSTYSLVEVLSPRSDIGLYPSNKNKKKKLKDQNIDKDKDSYSSVEFKFEEARDPATIVASFKKAEHQEIESMRDLRITNLQKRAEDNGDSKYCVCRKSLSGLMLQCELCKDWFHATCVPLPKSATLKNKSSPALVSQMAKDLKFLCPLCLRSRRPRLETILSLLVSLQKLPVRLPEGEALQCLTERAMSWQDRARQSLATEELAAALAKLSVLSQRMVEQAAREKTEKIINAELLKAASNPELQPHLQSMAQSAFGGLHSEHMLNADDSVQSSEDPALAEAPTEPVIVMDVETSNDGLVVPIPGALSPAPSQSSELQADTDLQQAYNSSEHAYSSASKPNQGPTPRKHARKSPLVPRQLETPVLELSDIAKAQLEELMMEGDLLEVSLDETQHIWRILQATKPRREDKFPDFEDLENDYGSDKEKEKKKKKRKLGEEDDDGGRKIKGKVKVKKEECDTKPKKRIKFDSNGKPIKKVLKCKEGNARDNVDTKREGKEIRDKTKPRKMKPTKKRNKDGNESGKLGERLERKKIKREMDGDSETDDDDDDDADDIDDNCAAAKCAKPTGQEVNWVQCDGGCEKWFHWLCVGLKKGDISENEDYICTGCSKRKPHELKSNKSGSVRTKQKFCKPQGKFSKKQRPTDSNGGTGPEDNVESGSANAIKDEVVDQSNVLSCPPASLMAGEEPTIGVVAAELTAELEVEAMTEFAPMLDVAELSTFTSQVRNGTSDKESML